MIFEHFKHIEVVLHGNPVGVIAKVPNKKSYAFQYFPSWVKNGYSISPFSLPLSNKVYEFEDKNFRYLPPAISDSLPDKFGNKVIDSELSRLGIDKNSITILDRLAYTGKNGLGALEFKPIFKLHDNVNSILKISDMVSVARNAIYGKFDSQNNTKKAINSILSVGTSAGGARPKAVINVNPETREITSGQISKKGLEPWILKFDGVEENNELMVSENFGKIEYAYSLMAKDCGINFPETRLLKENGRVHFMTKRFDRDFDLLGNPIKIHTQTLCALNSLDYTLQGVNDYAQLFTTMESLGLPESDKTEGFRRMVFNYAVSNYDDHTKNISFYLDEKNNWRLAPAYDITLALDSQARSLPKHNMGVLGKFYNVKKTDFLEMAEKFNIQYAKYSIKLINQSLEKWPIFGDRAGLLEDQIREVAAWLHKIE